MIFYFEVYETRDWTRPCVLKTKAHSIGDCWINNILVYFSSLIATYCGCPGADRKCFTSIIKMLSYWDTCWVYSVITPFLEQLWRQIGGYFPSYHKYIMGYLLELYLFSLYSCEFIRICCLWNVRVFYLYCVYTERSYSSRALSLSPCAWTRSCNLIV